MKYDAFICYRREGGDFLAKKLFEDLSKNGFNVFFDENIDKKNNKRKLKSIIFGSLYRSKSIIIIISPNCFDISNNKSKVRYIDEIKEALRYNSERYFNDKKTIIPIILYNRLNTIPFPEDIKEIAEGIAIEDICAENYYYKLVEVITRLGKHREEKRNAINPMLLVSLCVNIILLALCFIMLFSDIEKTEINTSSIIDTHTSEKSDSTDRDSAHKDDNYSQISDESSSLNESDIINKKGISMNTIWKEELYGFTAPTNIVNGGLSNFDGDYYYYGNTTLRSSNRYGSEIKILYDGPAYYINIVDDKIYFVSPSNNYAICRINKDGTDFKTVYNHPCHELSYYKGIFYFCCEEDNKFYICSMDKNELKTRKLYESNAWYMNVSQYGIIYYIDINNNNSLSSIKTDGTDQKVLLSDDKYYDLCVINNTILVSKNKDLRYLYCIDPVSLKQTQIRNSYTQNTNFSNNKLYFINEEQNLCCCDLDGSNYSIISDSENYNFISIIPELICCCKADNDSAVFILEDKYYE